MFTASVLELLLLEIAPRICEMFTFEGFHIIDSLMVHLVDIFVYRSPYKTPLSSLLFPCC
eukprot:m.109463 g.109463  ORF g.109463 m.109463 type:complete len:60 (+) comp14002_c1_seq16:611-790(+)